MAASGIGVDLLVLSFMFKVVHQVSSISFSSIGLSSTVHNRRCY